MLHRKPEIIQEQLADVRELLKVVKQGAEHSPEDFFLYWNLKQTQLQEMNLLAELEESIRFHQQRA